MSNYHNIGGMRMKYKEAHETFTEDQLVSDDPIEQFESWFEEIKKYPEIREPNAMCLATANKDGRPTARYVLLKGYGKEGFTFFTNSNSRKGQDMIRIEGPVTKIPEEESEKYFNMRPLQSQISAAASDQSSIIPSRDYLIEKAKAIEASIEENVPKPKHWGGYILKPNRIEFWQGQSDRLHDRICFILAADLQTWERVRLAP